MPARWAALTAAVMLPLAAPAQAQEATTDRPDKSAYHLFNPVPRELMRPLSADRPDATESPITVDAGHVQIETSFIDYVHDDEREGDLNAWTVFDSNVKFGVLNNVDVQFVFGAYGEEDTDPAGAASETIDGFGDLQIRTKINLWGNDYTEVGDTAFGIMPFVTIPTGTELSVEEPEGGVIAMLGWETAEKWGLGFQVEAGWVFDEDDDDYDTEIGHTAVLGFDIVGPLGGYVEYLGIASTDAGTDYRAFFSTGLTYELNADTVLDAGALVGLNDDAEDLNLFTGVTVRF